MRTSNNNYFIKNKSMVFFLMIFGFCSISCSVQEHEKNNSRDLSSTIVNQVVDTKKNPNQPQVATNFDNAYPISDFVRRIFQDSRGNLWLGTNGDGVIRYNGKSVEFFSFTKGFRGVAVRGILEDKDNNVWFATECGLNKYDGMSFTNYTYADGLPDNDLWSIFIDSQNVLWIGTMEGVCQYDGEKFTPFILPETEPDVLRGVSSAKIVNSITEDSKGNMWFGTPGGAFKYDGVSVTNLSEKDGLCNNSVNDILEDQAGNIWFATHHKGVSRYDGKSFTNYTANGVIEGDEVWSIFEDSKGNIWFPAENHGVYRFDGVYFTNYSEKDGLTTNAIQCIYEDRQGRIWLGGWTGLYRFNGVNMYSVHKNDPWE